jgi:sugar phosphate isomerase/epimerase
MKIGLMNNPAAPVRQEAIAIGKAKYDFLDLTIEPPQALDIDTADLARILVQYRLGIVGHTDPCLPYAYPLAGIRQACLRELERCARIFAALKARVMNIHPCYTRPPAMRGALVDLNIEALGPIVDMARGYGLAVVFENFRAPFDSVAVHERILNEVPGLKLHLDVGHANMGRDDATVFCKRLGRHIGHVHFSDNRSSGDHHMPLGVGNVNWPQVVAALKKVGYDETITLEVFCDEPAVQFQYLELSRNFLRDLWHG